MLCHMLTRGLLAAGHLQRAYNLRWWYSALGVCSHRCPAFAYSLGSLRCFCSWGTPLTRLRDPDLCRIRWRSWRSKVTYLAVGHFNCRVVGVWRPGRVDDHVDPVNDDINFEWCVLVPAVVFDYYLRLVFHRSELLPLALQTRSLLTGSASRE